MKVVFGLGNPDKEYEKTRHNVGFIMIDKLAERYGVEFNKKGYKAHYAEFNYKGEKVLFVKPQTYMNLSGESVLAVAKFYKLDVSDILIIYDDIDLPIGKIRFREKGSAGTHNGMRNIISLMHSTEIPRVRVGIDVERHPNFKLMDFVLQRFSSGELNTLDELYDEIYEKVENHLTK